MEHVSLVFYGLFAVLAVLTALLYYYVQGRPGAAVEGATPEFKVFQRKYLYIYVAVMAADWLQGPYVYALYKSYGFGAQEIAQLFVAGFSSSMVAGTIAGGLADKLGRKRLALAFCVIYALSCGTKLSASYSVLMAGRLLAGVATSLLFSVFEAWMVSEHHSRGFADAALSQTFALAVFWNGVGAIGSGLLAGRAAEVGGYVAPFMVALVVLIACGVFIAQSWTENYGDAKLEVVQGARLALSALRSPPVALLGAVTALFEASMYTFVFLWSPVLISAFTGAGHAENLLDFGTLFASFMVCIMTGSSLFALALHHGFSPHSCLRAALFIGAAALAMPLLTSQWLLQLLAFFAFEVACGLYFPSAGTLRSRIIPEESRAAVMNLFRIPLNGLVVGVLLNYDGGKSMSNLTTFAILVCWLLAALACHTVLVQVQVHEEALETKDEHAEE